MGLFFTATVEAEAPSFMLSMSYHHRRPISYVSRLAQSKHLPSLIKINPLPAGNLQNTTASVPDPVIESAE